MKRTTEPTNFLQLKTARYLIMIIFVVLKNYKIITKAEIVKEVSNITKSTTVIIPEHKVPAFKPCTDFKNQVK